VVSTIVGAVKANDHSTLWIPDVSDGLARSLAGGDFRLVLVCVLDNAPDELVQGIGHLNLVASRVIVDLITVSAYEVKGSRILVAQRVEPARRHPNFPRPGPCHVAEVRPTQVGVLRWVWPRQLARRRCRRAVRPAVACLKVARSACKTDDLGRRAVARHVVPGPAIQLSLTTPHACALGLITGRHTRRLRLRQPVRAV
jgi:hypothetical protein